MGRKKKTYEEVKGYFEASGTCKLITTEEDFDELHKTAYSSQIEFELLCGRCKEKTFTVTMSRFKERNKTVCYDCAIKDRSWSIEKVHEYVKNNSDCILLSDTYGGVRQVLTYQCGCGDSFQTTFAKFKDHSQRKCKACAEKIRRSKIATFSYQDVLSYVESKGCMLLTDEKDYVNTKRDLWIVGVCNHMFLMSFQDFKKRKESFDCTDCLGRTTWDIRQIRNWFKENLRGYKLKSKRYKDQKTKLKIECPSGHLYEKSLIHVLRGQLCSVCTSSSGEQAIQYYLKEHEVNFKRQYWIADCKDEKPLPFDFGVLHKNGSLKCLIEFHGRQHYEPVDFGDTTKEEAKIRFADRQKKDSIKEEYCKLNNIKLIVLPYWEFGKIETILNKHL